MRLDVGAECFLCVALLIVHKLSVLHSQIGRMKWVGRTTGGFLNRFTIARCIGPIGVSSLANCSSDCRATFGGNIGLISWSLPAATSGACLPSSDVKEGGFGFDPFLGECAFPSCWWKAFSICCSPIPGEDGSILSMTLSSSSFLWIFVLKVSSNGDCSLEDFA